MRNVSIADKTIRQSGTTSGYTLSFREKLEIAKLLEKMKVDVIELHPIENAKADTLLIKSVCSSVQDCVIAVPAGRNAEEIATTWKAMKEAKRPRLQVQLPVSDAQMEYLAGKKPTAMLNTVEELVTACRACCSDVEFIAVDATRSNFEFLTAVLEKAIADGATTITVCDTAGTLLAHEFGAFIRRLYAAVPPLTQVTLGVECSDAFCLAEASAVAAVLEGAGEIKTVIPHAATAGLAQVVHILAAKAEALEATCRVKTTQMKQTVEKIQEMCNTSRSTRSPFDNGVREGEKMFLGAHNSMESVIQAVTELGYDLSPEDHVKVFEEFSKIAGRKETVGAQELDAIVASVALQVPPTYWLDSYVINTGNTIGATAHMKLIKDGKVLEGISIGDGSIDAAFLAIEQIVGQHFELDDFQIDAITEGREAMGESVVKLRCDGKIYSGRGISTDIIGASINAYINALNKIVYEETEN